MNFGRAIGTACATFALTNIDDIFVLVTFFTESTTSSSLTPLRITIGQYLGFTVLVIISLAGFGASFLFPPEPIGFLGLVPILLGVWWLFSLVFKAEDDEDDNDDANIQESTGKKVIIAAKAVLRVASMTVVNGADNLSVYIPLFAQANGPTIALYIVVYYMLLGLWCLLAFLVLKQKHILRIAQKYAHIVVPFLYVGLGIFIIVQSECYPWSIERIDDKIETHPGTIIVSTVTTGLLLTSISCMFCAKVLKKQEKQTEAEAGPSEEGGSAEEPKPASDRTKIVEPSAGDGSIQGQIDQKPS